MCLGKTILSQGPTENVHKDAFCGGQRDDLERVSFGFLKERDET